MVGEPAAFAAAIVGYDVSLRLIKRFEKSTCPSALPIGGITMSSTKEETILPKAAPMITPTARSRTLPRIANSLNSFSMPGLLLAEDVMGGPMPHDTLVSAKH